MLKDKELTLEERITRYKKRFKVAKSAYILSLALTVATAGVGAYAICASDPDRKLKETVERIKTSEAYQDFVDNENIEAYYKMVEGEISLEEYYEYSQWLYTDDAIKEYLKDNDDENIKQQIADYERQVEKFRDVGKKALIATSAVGVGAVTASTIPFVHYADEMEKLKKANKKSKTDEEEMSAE